MVPLKTSLLDLMTDVVGVDNAFVDPGRSSSYERDWSGRYGSRSSMVVRPSTTDEVVAVMRIADESGVSIVPQGGNTGLVGGGVPRAGELVLSLSRLTHLEPINSALAMVTVGAGVTLAELQRHAAASGFDAAMDFAARDSCTIGGIVACDAGGIRALRHGTAAARVIGLEAVLADGTVVSRMTGLRKDNAGLSLPRLLVGSEGTLGVITRVCWKLETRARARTAVLFGVPSTTAAIDALRALVTGVPALESCDYVAAPGFELALAEQGRSNPLSRSWPIYVFAEATGAESALADFSGALEAAHIDDVVVAEDTQSADELWALREGVTHAVSGLGVPHKMDVGVPLHRLGIFLERLDRVVSDIAEDARLVTWGHLGDGNVHVNVVGPPADDSRVDDAVLALTLECGGTISAEHGIGTSKAHWLERARGAGEVGAMRAVKRALDPGWRLNPGAVLADEAAPVPHTACGARRG